MLKRYIVALLTGLTPGAAGYAQVIFIEGGADYLKRNEPNSAHKTIGLATKCFLRA